METYIIQFLMALTICAMCATLNYHATVVWLKLITMGGMLSTLGILMYILFKTVTQIS